MSAPMPSILIPILSVRNEAIPLPTPQPQHHSRFIFSIRWDGFLASYVSQSWHFHIRDLGSL